MYLSWWKRRPRRDDDGVQPSTNGAILHPSAEPAGIFLTTATCGCHRGCCFCCPRYWHQRSKGNGASKKISQSFPSHISGHHWDVRRHRGAGAAPEGGPPENRHVHHDNMDPIHPLAHISLTRPPSTTTSGRAIRTSDLGCVGRAGPPLWRNTKGRHGRAVEFPAPCCSSLLGSSTSPFDIHAVLDSSSLLILVTAPLTLAHRHRRRAA